MTSVWISVAPQDWQCPEGVAGGTLHMQVISVSADESDEPGWVRAHGWHHALVGAEMPELATYLVRRSALHPPARALLEGQVQQPAPELEQVRPEDREWLCW